MAKVLVVNDERDLVETACLVLEAEGHVTSSTLAGTRTLALAREQRPDVILLDFVLADTDGARVLAALRADDGLRAIPVVMMSALEDGAARAARAGADAFLQKPFTAEELLDAIEKAVRSPSPR